MAKKNPNEEEASREGEAPKEEKDEKAPEEKPAEAPKAMPAPSGGRPKAVLVISILGFLLSLMALLGGVSVMFLGGMVAATYGPVGLALGGSAMLMGIIPLIIGVVGLIAFYMLLKMKRLGWILVTVIGILDIVMAALSFDMVSMGIAVVWAVIIIYLFTKRSLFA